MTEEPQFTIKEVMNQRFDEMANHLQEIKAQTTKTNGRVTGLETSRTKIWTAISVLLALGGAFITLSWFVIKGLIEKTVNVSVNTAINNKFDSIEITK